MGPSPNWATLIFCVAMTGSFEKREGECTGKGSGRHVSLNGLDDCGAIGCVICDVIARVDEVRFIGDGFDAATLCPDAFTGFEVKAHGKAVGFELCGCVLFGYAEDNLGVVEGASSEHVQMDGVEGADGCLDALLVQTLQHYFEDELAQVALDAHSIALHEAL